MKLADYIQQQDALQPPETQGAEENVSEELLEQLRLALYREIPSEKIAQLARLGRSAARNELGAMVEQILCAGEFPSMSQAVRERLVADTLDMVLGLGPIEALLEDATITEVIANGPKALFFEREGVLHASKETFFSEEQLRLVVDRIVSPLGRRVDEQSPIVSARLPEGHRVNVVIPPLSIDGTALTIRKFREKAFTLEELVQAETLSEEIVQLLDWAVRARKSIAVSGGTGAGKTTLLNALSRQIPPSERIITIEDSAELRFDHHSNLVRLEARMANAEGKGQVTIRDLVINALRMRPDRIIVGECRGAEALDMLQAMNTGHAGSLTTLHANSPEEVVPRLVMMVRYGMDLSTSLIEAQITSALDMVVQQDRLGGGKRRVTQIVVKKEQAQGDRLQQGFFQRVVMWDRRRNAYVWEHVPAWVEELPYLEVASKEEVTRWVQSVSRL